MRSKDDLLNILKLIEVDMENDIKCLKGKPFSAKNISEHLGKVNAAISALASIISDHIIGE